MCEGLQENGKGSEPTPSNMGWGGGERLRGQNLLTETGGEGGTIGGGGTHIIYAMHRPQG
jgi:hypothetical protein